MKLSPNDMIEVLRCPACGQVDVDFEKRSETLVRCGLCQRFIIVTGTEHIPTRDQSAPGIVTLRGLAFAPTPPRQGRCAAMLSTLAVSALLLLDSANVMAGGQGWWCTQATAPYNGYTFSACYRSEEACQKFRSFNKRVDLMECMFQKNAVAFSFFDKMRDTTEQRVANTTVSCQGNRAFLLKSEQRNDISHVTKCKVVE